MQVFLDLDGVIVDFAGGLFKANKLDIKDFNVVGKWWLHQATTIAQEVFERPCRTWEFWKNLEFTPEAREIITLLEDRFKQENITLFTSPSQWPESSFGKHLWINEHMPEYGRKFILGHTKHVVAKIPGAVLVDDRNENIDDFNQTGGVGILVPRPWNRHHDLDVMSFLRKRLDHDDLRSL